MGGPPRGFTATELLVAIGVIGLLAAITLPAIQSSREASRRTTCSSHLHQMGIASQNHVATYGHYPHRARPGNKGGIYGPLYALLPFVEAQPPTNDNPVQVEVYQCPTEPHPDWGHAGSTSYLVNNGSRIYLRPDWIAPRGGLVSEDGPLRPRDVTDGEAHTAMFSERMLTPTSQSVDITPDEAAEIYHRYPLVCTWRLGTSFFYGQEDAFRAACGDATRRSPFATIRPGANPSIQDTISNPFYEHVLPPNTPGCMYIEPPRPYLGSQGRLEFTLPANSAHPGGVTLVLCDGATKFVSDGIDVHVWGAIGTRNGGEPHGPY